MISSQKARSKRVRKTVRKAATPKAQSSASKKLIASQATTVEKKAHGKRGPGKATLAAREAIGKFVDGNAHRLQRWLDQIADGIPPKLDERKRPIPGTAVPPDPLKASQLFIQVIEYHVPKLARTEFAGDPDNPIEHRVETVTRRIIKADSK